MLLPTALRVKFDGNKTLRCYVGVENEESRFVLSIIVWLWYKPTAAACSASPSTTNSVRLE